MSPWRDVIIVLAVTVSAALIAAYFELSELIFAFTRRWEHVQLDEWPIAVFVLALGFAWLSWRRYRLAVNELRARLLAEARLSEALATNRKLAQQHLSVQETERKTRIPRLWFAWYARTGGDRGRQLSHRQCGRPGISVRGAIAGQDA